MVTSAESPPLPYRDATPDDAPVVYPPLEQIAWACGYNVARAQLMAQLDEADGPCPDASADPRTSAQRPMNETDYRLAVRKRMQDAAAEIYHDMRALGFGHQSALLHVENDIREVCRDD